MPDHITSLGKEKVDNEPVPVAQLDRVSASEAEGRGFESHRVHHSAFSFHSLRLVIERLPPKEKVVGSNPARITKNYRNSRCFLMVYLFIALTRGVSERNLSSCPSW